MDGQVTGTSVTLSRRLSRPVTGGPTGAAAVRVPAPEDRHVATVGGDPPLVRVRGAVDALSADRFRQQVLAVSRGGTGPLTVDLTLTSQLTSQLTSMGVAVLVDLLGARRDADDGDGDGDSLTLVAPTGTPAAYVLELVGLPRSAG